MFYRLLFDEGMKPDFTSHPSHACFGNRYYGFN